MTVAVHNNFVAEAKMARVLKLMRMLCEYKFTIKELSEQLDVPQRTVYRYLALLEFMDIPVEKSFDKHYFIVEGNCPLCGKSTEKEIKLRQTA